jgi:HEPN domain-containing protein
MLRMAHRDLKAARAMLASEIFDEATWGFQIQQATEKALKAWISCLDHVYPFIHDLAVLRRLITDSAPILHASCPWTTSVRSRPCSFMTMIPNL